MQIRKAIQSFNRYLFYLAAIPLVTTMLLTVIDVSGRYFRHPLPGAMEVTQLLLAVVIGFALAHTQAEKGNIDVDLVFNFMPSWAQSIANAVNSILSMLIISVIAWQTIPWVLVSKRMTEWTDILQLPIWLFKAAVFLGMLCLALQLLLDTIDYFRELRHPHAKAGGEQAPKVWGSGLE